MTMAALWAGLGIAAACLGVIVWSIAWPERRIWPPRSYGPVTPYLVWFPTLALFAIIFTLGVFGWGEIDLPRWLRYGVGGPLLAAGHIAVWFEVARFGLHQTGGARGKLKTDRLYRFSRNPQYVADVAILIGWVILSASFTAAPVAVAVIAILIAAPFAEEPWMEESYGEMYLRYKCSVRRYL